MKNMNCQKTVSQNTCRNERTQDKYSRVSVLKVIPQCTCNVQLATPDFQRITEKSRRNFSKRTIY
jgi:hypothetical protein